MDVVAELAQRRVAATSRLESLGSEIDALVAAAVDSNLDDEHDPEGSTIAFEREQLSALRAAARSELGEIDDALRRVGAGTYGSCERCGEPIGAERLAALPRATQCIACAGRLKRPSRGRTCS